MRDNDGGHMSFVVQTHRRRNVESAPWTRVPDVSCRLWGLMTCACRSLAGMKAPRWWGTLTVGEAVPAWGQEVHGESLDLPLSVAGNPKLFSEQSFQPRHAAASEPL